MKIFHLFIFYCLFPIHLLAQNEYPFVERQINGFIYGSTSIHVNDYNNDSLQDILAYPVKDRGVGLYTNIGDLDFNLKHCWFNFDINTLSYANIYGGGFSDLVLFSDSTVHIAKGALDTFLVTESFNLPNGFNTVDKTHDDLAFLGLDSLGQLALIHVDTNNVTVENILGQDLISSFRTEIIQNDTSHIFTYSDSLQSMSHIRLFDDSVEVNNIADSLEIHSTFSTFYSDDFHIVCSSLNTDSVFHFTLHQDSLSQEIISASYSNTPIIQASESIDTLVYHYLWREDFYQGNYYADYEGYRINEALWFEDSIHADIEFLNYMNHCETMISVNLDGDLENEYVLYTALLDQITIYKNIDTCFNISRANTESKIKTFVADMDRDGDLDGVSMMLIPNDPVGGNCDIVYFENIGNYKFINQTIHRSRYSEHLGIIQPVSITLDSVPNVFFSYDNNVLVLRYWKDENGKDNFERLDTLPFHPSGTYYSHDGLYLGDLEGDGDDDIFLTKGKSVRVFQNRDSTFVRWVNTFGAGNTDHSLNYKQLGDHDNNGSENAFIGVSRHTKKPGYFTIKRGMNTPGRRLQLDISNFNLFMDLREVLDNEEKATGGFIDWNLDGYMDFVYRDARHGWSKESTICINNGDYTFDTTNVITYYTIEDGDTVYPAYNIMYDFENNFKQNIIKYSRDSYKRHIVENDSTCNVYTIFPFDEYSSISSYIMKVDDFDKDGDDDFVGPNGSHGHSFYENTTCNSKSVIHVDFCESYVSPSGTYTWTTPGVYYDVVSNVNGCDSTIKIHLSSLSNTESLLVTECSSYDSPSGTYTWNESGIYTDTIINQDGCDSILIIDLSIGDTYKVLDVIQCDSMVSPSLNQIWYASGGYLDTVIESNGCRTYYDINLEIEEAKIEIYQSDSNLALANNGSDITQVEWYNCDLDSIVYLNGNTFTPDTSGWYSAIINTVACMDTLSCVFYKKFNGVNDNINVYINGPFINIDFLESVDDLNVELYNINGQLIKVFNKQNALNELIDLSAYSYGIYIVAITYDNTNIVRKIPWVKSVQNFIE